MQRKNNQLMCATKLKDCDKKSFVSSSSSLPLGALGSSSRLQLSALTAKISQAHPRSHLLASSRPLLPPRPFSVLDQQLQPRHKYMDQQRGGKGPLE